MFKVGDIVGWADWKLQESSCFSPKTRLRVVGFKLYMLPRQWNIVCDDPVFIFTNMYGSGQHYTWNPQFEDGKPLFKLIRPFSLDFLIWNEA